MRTARIETRTRKKWSANKESECSRREAKTNKNFLLRIMAKGGHDWATFAVYDTIKPKLKKVPVSKCNQCRCWENRYSRMVGQCKENWLRLTVLWRSKSLISTPRNKNSITSIEIVCLIRLERKQRISSFPLFPLWLPPHFSVFLLGLKRIIKPGKDKSTAFSYASERISAFR